MMTTTTNMNQRALQRTDGPSTADTCMQMDSKPSSRLCWFSGRMHGALSSAQFRPHLESALQTRSTRLIMEFSMTDVTTLGFRVSLESTSGRVEINVTQTQRGLHPEHQKNMAAIFGEVLLRGGDLI
ncbi:Hypothetical predicted protein [Xyrichtys novacula]|uniref:Uncharacterized protein n=1 Tax=Xyrichtys novacula TaxID=13765 RepID=A0AAV1GDB9_XYRNO|nr:Hypothetical predicted protein [Xyrichtys novacula]